MVMTTEERIASRYRYGKNTSVLLGLLFTITGFILLSTTQNEGYAVLPFLLLAFLCGVPMLLILFVTWIRLLGNNLGERKLVQLWLPAAMGALVLPLMVNIGGSIMQAAYPTIEEMHVNLTGRDLRIVYLELDGQDPGRFTRETRYPWGNSDSDIAYRDVYDGRRLAPGFTSIKASEGQIDWAKAKTTTLPVLLRGKYPLGGRSFPDMTPRYIYYYYPDRVEVAPTLGDWGMRLGDASALREPVIEVMTHNFAEKAIVRLEIDGMAIGLNTSIEPLTPERCWSFAKPLIHRLAGPLRVRWQYAETDAKWHEATVSAPAFRSANAPPGVLQDNRLHLLVQADGKLSAQRSQLFDNGNGRSSVRFTKPIVPMNTSPSCGVTDTYADSVQRIAD